MGKLTALCGLMILSVVQTSFANSKCTKRTIQDAIAVFAHTQLRDFPGLGERLSQLNAEGLIPLPVQRIIHDAAANQDTAVAVLTDEIRGGSGWKEEGGIADVGVFASFEYDGRKYIAPALPEELADNGLRRDRPTVFLDPRWSADWVLRLLDRFAGPPTLSQMQLLGALVHELAHVRFDAFFWRNFEALVNRGNWPRWAVASVDGRLFVGESFYMYVAERYAFEAQLVMNQATIRRWAAFPTLLSASALIGPISASTDPVVARRRIGQQLRSPTSTYRLTDPLLEPFDSMTVAQILLRGDAPQ